MKIKLFYFFFFLSLIFPHRTFADEIASGSSANFGTYHMVHPFGGYSLEPSFAGVMEQQRQDHRVKILEEYLTKANSPLASYANEFVTSADAYNIPWYLVAAISGTESTFGQQVPYSCNNAWGYGIYADHTQCFESYPQAIKKISQSLREDYMNKEGVSSIEEIGRIYAASPAWAAHTQYFIDQILFYKDQYESRIISISL